MQWSSFAFSKNGMDASVNYSWFSLVPPPSRSSQQDNELNNICIDTFRPEQDNKPDDITNKEAQRAMLSLTHHTM